MIGTPQERTQAFESCLLNTCIRFARETYPELTLLNYQANMDFVDKAAKWLETPFFMKPIESAMESARTRLIKKLTNIVKYSTVKD